LPLKLAEKKRKICMSAAVYDIYVTYDLSFFTGVFIFRPCLSLAMTLVLSLVKWLY
jgi:hypothetical protein